MLHLMHLVSPIWGARILKGKGSDPLYIQRPEVKQPWRAYLRRGALSLRWGWGVRCSLAICPHLQAGQQNLQPSWGRPVRVRRPVAVI